jgi:hypothetical protein
MQWIMPNQGPRVFLGAAGGAVAAANLAAPACSAPMSVWREISPEASRHDGRRWIHLSGSQMKFRIGPLQAGQTNWRQPLTTTVSGRICRSQPRAACSSC